MRLGSLFSGIGGLDLACERVFGAETVWQVEGVDRQVGWDALAHPCLEREWERLRQYVRHGDFNRKVLARHWPNARQFCDVRTVGAHNLEPVDVICGGFPCQDLSVAGTGAGLEGKRSGLYRELHRIVGELRPQYVVIENVPGLLKYQETLAEDFNALGYGLRWQPIAAQDVGAPHRRRRVFVLACRDWRGSVVLDAPQAGEQVAAWPTPMAGTNRKSRKAMSRSVGNGRRSGGGNSSTPGLEQAVEMAGGTLPPELQGLSPADVALATRAMWPTPTARNGTSGPTKVGRPGHGGGALHDVVRALWPTPRARHDSGRGTKGDLTTQGAARAAAWPTPTAGDAKSSGSRNLEGSGAHAGTSLTDAVRPDRAKAWPTPTARDSRSGTGTGTERGHAPCLPELVGGNLNPAWVELLMGLPPGWSAAPRAQWDLFAPKLEAMAWPGAHRWPAGRPTSGDDTQPAGEPPRLVPPRSVPDRNLRLRSLGNGVVPHQAIAALRLLRDR